ncbi:hypothetical protein BDV95DRAFT_144558 [Massariosphaeria phaeospora]|uniref:Uncharacterized protein n=1 Tax=Massariosphaeria phaeospora TaxID=100035 RepID=A0A7C8IIN7_9PLEO|nr:hypothetical protein BDV95DRAFT_144558 [Massariosphaeria phaeospora]
MSLATIEKLFILRTNLLALGDLRGILRAPLLFFMALLVWCLGLATIYPPGALIVTFDAHTFTDNYNMSVLNPPIPQNLDFAGNDSFPTLSDGGSVAPLVVSYPNPGNGTEDIVERVLTYSGPAQALNNIAQSVIIDNHVFNMLIHPGENSTYKLQFRGPQFRCKTSRYNHSIPMEYRPDDGITSAVFVSEWHEDALTLSVKQRKLGNYSIVHSTPNTTRYEAHVETLEQSCGPVSVFYHVDVTFPRGVQTIQHYLSDEKDMPKKAGAYDDLNLTLPAQPQTARAWNQRVLAALPIYNEWALLDALGSLLVGEFYINSQGSDPDSCRQSQSFKNGTIVQDCWEWGFQMQCDFARVGLLKGTVFHTTRFDATEPNSCYDPRDALHITEELLNSVLTNITLSAISLGTWWAMVPVTTTRYRSTYSFAYPLALILPYSICLAAASLFAAIAVWSLWQNGTPAADGGFLQIMLATRGNTEMERLVLKERLTAVENMSEELQKLEIRYGELVGGDVLRADGRICGFGTVDETVSLRLKKGN